MGEETRTKGRDALAKNIAAVKFIGDIVKTTLGPKGMDKMLITSDGRLVITNDGVTILEKMKIDHPVGSIIKDIARTQEREVGDGTTTVAMLAGKLLENAWKLVEKGIHPTIIVKGYEMAKVKALKVLGAIAVKLSDDYLEKVAQTALTGKSAENIRVELSKIIVEAVQISELKKLDSEGIKIVRTTSETEKAELVRGVVLNKEIHNDSMPKEVLDPKIALVSYDLEIKNMERESQIQISNPRQFQQFVDQERSQMDEMVAKIVDSGAKVVFCNLGIDDYVFSRFAANGVLAFRRIIKGDMERLARATGARIVSSQQELEIEDLGSCSKIYQKKFKDDSLIYIEGCKNPKDVSIVVYGTSDHLVDEIARAMTDAIGDVIAANHSKLIVAGGGATELEIAKQLRKFAKTLDGREQLAIEEFANAMDLIPETLAENAGLDSIEQMTRLTAVHEIEGNDKIGLNLFNSEIEDTVKAGIIEPLKIKTHAISSATEVSKIILRVDDILIGEAAPQ